MFGVENQRCLHGLNMQRHRLFIVQRPEKLFGNRVSISLNINAYAIVAVVVPIINQARKDGQHAVDGVQLAGKIRFLSKVPQHGAAGA